MRMAELGDVCTYGCAMLSFIMSLSNEHWATTEFRGRRDSLAHSADAAKVRADSVAMEATT